MGTQPFGTLGFPICDKDGGFPGTFVRKINVKCLLAQCLADGICSVNISYYSFFHGQFHRVWTSSTQIVCDYSDGEETGATPTPKANAGPRMLITKCLSCGFILINIKLKTANIISTVSVGGKCSQLVG